MTTRSSPIRIAFADDSFLMREAVHQVMEHPAAVELVATCEDGESLLAAVERERPDVVVTDVRMPPSGDDEGIRIAQRLRDHTPRHRRRRAQPVRRAALWRRAARAAAARAARTC